MSIGYDIISLQPSPLPRSGVPAQRVEERGAISMTTELDCEKLAALTPLDALEQAAECLKILAHPHRLRIVQMLLRDRYTVGELAEACGIPSHMASEHLHSCSGAAS